MTERRWTRRRTPSGTAYVDVGSGEPLVFVHGVGLRLEAWAPQIETYAPRYRVIALDMPGHGESDPIASGARLPAFVEWLNAVIDELGVAPANLVGHSMGALISLGMTVTHPTRVARAAMLNAVYRRSAEVLESVRARAAMLESGRNDVEGPLARWYEPERSAAEARLAELSRQWLSGVDLAGYATAYRAFAEGDHVYADRLHEIACPTLFLTGALDPNSTPAMTRAMAALAPRARAVVVADERHMTSLVAPGPVNLALDEWLRQPMERAA